MRVCLVTSAPFPPGEGLGYHVWNLAQQLTRSGHHVGIITRGRAGRPAEERRDGITLWRLPFVPVYPFHVHLHSYFVNHFFRGIEAQFDVVNAHTPLPAVLNTRLPMVATVHSPMRSDTAATHGTDLHTLAVRLQTPFSRQIESDIFARSQRITVVARWVAEALSAYGVDPARVTVTGNGVEPAFLADSSRSTRQPFVLYAGRLEPGKGLEDLVEAARIYVQRCPDSDLRFVLVGSGSLLPRLQNLVSQAGLERRFDFRGQIPAEQRNELVQLYRTTAVFVLPSHHEGMPTVLLEAMASGAPVISTAVGGALEVVTPGESGYLVPVAQPENLASLLIELMEDNSLRQRLGTRAREIVDERYSWNAVGSRYLASYAEALDAKG